MNFEWDTVLEVSVLNIAKCKFIFHYLLKMKAE